jgi:hypothetical protein
MIALKTIGSGLGMNATGGFPEKAQLARKASQLTSDPSIFLA